MAKWIVESPRSDGKPASATGDSVAVYSKADLDRRLAEAKQHGIKVTVRPAHR